ncbi:integrase core domain-containing protein [Paraburkholderia sp. J69-1]
MAQHQVRRDLLRAYQSVSHARRCIGDYIGLYNRKRLHSSLADQTPD